VGQNFYVNTLLLLVGISTLNIERYPEMDSYNETQCCSYLLIFSFVKFAPSNSGGVK